MPKLPWFVLKPPSLRRIVDCPLCHHEQAVRFKNNEIEAVGNCKGCGQAVVFRRPYTGCGYWLIR